MSKHDSSLQSQTPVSQAQNSANKARRAVEQALSHPSEQTMEQAANSIERAERAIEQASESEDQNGLELAEEMLAENIRELNELKAGKKNRKP
jgi:hypothetical protein